MKLSIIIPTLQAGAYLPRLLTDLRAQSTSASEIIVVDSSSTDQTALIARENGCRLRIIPRETFRHGGARNLGARLTQGKTLVFLTQDSLPTNTNFLEELTRPILDGRAAAVSARQLPYPDANPIEKLTREFNYPPESNLRSWQDVPRLGIKAFFFSNSASAIKRDVFWELGGFSEEVIVDEDLEFCARLLKAGYSAAYQADAVVYHSHNYTLAQLFKRYYDIGIFFNQAEELLEDVPLQQEGWRYLSQLSKELIRDNKQLWIPRLIMEASIKFSAYHLGLRYQVMPNRIKRKLSGQSYYW